MSKKIVALLLALVMVLSMAACTSNTKQEAAPEKPAETAPEDNAPEAAAPEESAEKEPASEGETVETVKIGVLLPYSGASAKQGEMEGLGIDLYTERFNEAGGFQSLGGAKVELVYADSTTSAEVGQTEFQRLVEVEGVVAVLGPINSPVAAVTMPMADRYHIPYLIVNSGANTLNQEPYEYCFRANVSDSKALQMYADFFAYLGEEHDYDIDTVYCVYENTDWGVGTADVMEAICDSMGITCIRESFTTNAADFSTIINKIKASSADIVYMSSMVNDANLFSVQMNEYDCHIPTIGGGGGWILTEYINMTGVDLTNEAFVFVTAFSKDVLDIKGQVAQEIADIIYERTGEGVNDNTANGYLDAGILYQAIEDAGSTDADAIVKALENMNMPADHPALALHPYESVQFGTYDPGFGLPVQYNENLTSTPSITQLIDGEFRLVWPLPEGYETPLIWPAEPFTSAE